MKKNLWMLALLLLAGLAVTFVIAIAAEPVQPQSEEPALSLDTNIVISEICSKNESVIADNEGKYRDYIELYNGGDALSLAGFTWYDGKVKSEPLGDIILEAGEYRIFFFGRSQTGFALSASGGETIQLLDAAGKIVVQTNTAALNTDEAMLYSDGGYKNSFEVSPGFSNDAEGRKAFLEGMPAQSPNLVISEVLIANASALPDEKGNFCDMVELYNASETTVNLGRYFLSDSRQDRFCYRLPEYRLDPGAYLVICCDGENYISADGMIHTNFGLSHGEELILTENTGEYVSVNATYAGEDISILRIEDGSYTTGDPSLGYSNDAMGVALLEQSRINTESALVISEVLLSSAGVPYNGEFCDVVEITNVSEEKISTAGWYLSDGGDPYRYALPVSTLDAGESVVISCGPTTTGFSLSDGETLRLTGPDFRYALPVCCTAPEFGKSISLQGRGEESAYAYMDPTLGYPNEPGYWQPFAESQMSKDLQISEVMSSNRSYLRGPYATTSDWVELYNASDREIQLSQYYLTDAKGNLKKYRLPDRLLGVGEYCVILLKDDPTNLLKDYDFLPMPLSSDGETLYLSKENQIVDYLFLPELAMDMAYGRAEDSIFFSLLKTPTPGRKNSEIVEITAAPVAETPQGCYDDVEYVDVVLSGEGDIYYTTSCYAPTVNSTRYTGPIRLTKTTVLRVMCVQEGKRKSEIVDFTYIINENDTLPVVSLVTSPDNLWSIDHGIYILGNNAEEEEPHKGANYWMDWEKPASISLYETDGSGFSVNCGIKIFGGFTRVLDKKSLACFFREVYGDGELNYPVFGEDGLDTYEAFVLRTAGQDAFGAKMKDVVNTSLIGEYTDVPVQNYRPVIVYLNGEYWGLHYIREKLNENYIAGHYNMKPEDVTIVKLTGWTCQEYIDLLHYTANHDMRVQEHYDYVCSKIDVDNYIDFYIAEMWIANTDIGNVRYFLSEEGKWTWILYDTDISMLDSSMDRVASNLSKYNIGPGDISCKTFAVTLMENPEFRDKFLRRLAWQMNTIWTEENVIGRINEIEAMLIADMPKETDRWIGTYEEWVADVEHLRRFARERNGYMLEHIKDHFDLSDAEMRAYGFKV